MGVALNLHACMHDKQSSTPRTRVVPPTGIPHPLMHPQPPLPHTDQPHSSGDQAAQPARENTPCVTGMAAKNVPPLTG